MLTYKTHLHDALNRHVEENVNPGLVIAEPGKSNLYFLSETVVLKSHDLIPMIHCALTSRHLV